MSRTHNSFRDVDDLPHWMAIFLHLGNFDAPHVAPSHVTARRNDANQRDDYSGAAKTNVTLPTLNIGDK